MKLCKAKTCISEPSVFLRRLRKLRVKVNKEFQSFRKTLVVHARMLQFPLNPHKNNLADHQMLDIEENEENLPEIKVLPESVEPAPKLKKTFFDLVFEFQNLDFFIFVDTCLLGLATIITDRTCFLWTPNTAYAITEA